MVRLILELNEPQDSAVVKSVIEALVPGVEVAPVFRGGTEEMRKKYISVQVPDGFDTAHLIDAVERRFSLSGYYREPLAEPASGGAGHRPVAPGPSYLAGYGGNES